MGLRETLIAEYDVFFAQEGPREFDIRERQLAGKFLKKGRSSSSVKQVNSFYMEVARLMEQAEEENNHE